MRYLIYHRVSRDEKHTGSCSLPWQKQETDAWLARNKVQFDKEYEDNGVTAVLPLRERPEGKELWEEAAKGGCVVLCAKLDRVFRNNEDFARTVPEWTRQGIIFVSALEVFDLTTKYGRFVAGIMSLTAQLEVETIRERNLESKAFRRSRGMRLNQEAPYGYRYHGEIAKPEGGFTGGVLVKDAGEQRVIGEIKRWRKQGMSIGKITSALNAAGYPTRRGGQWGRSMVQKLLETMKERTGKRAFPAGFAEEMAAIGTSNDNLDGEDDA